MVSLGIFPLERPTYCLQSALDFRAVLRSRRIGIVASGAAGFYYQVVVDEDPIQSGIPRTSNQSMENCSVRDGASDGANHALVLLYPGPAKSNLVVPSGTPVSRIWCRAPDYGTPVDEAVQLVRENSRGLSSGHPQLREGKGSVGILL